MRGDFDYTPNIPSTSSQRETADVALNSDYNSTDQSDITAADAIRAHPFFPVITLLMQKCADGMVADCANVFDIEDVIQLLQLCALESGKPPPASTQIDALVCAAICTLRLQLDELRKVWQYSALFHQRYIQYVKRKNDAKCVNKSRSDDQKSLSSWNENDDDDKNNSTNRKFNTDENSHEPSNDVDDNSSSYDDNETSPSPNGSKADPDQEPMGVGIHSLAEQLWRQIAEQQHQLKECQPKIEQMASNGKLPPSRKRRPPFDDNRLIPEKSPRLDN